jgi:hypothetical protein
MNLAKERVFFHRILVQTTHRQNHSRTSQGSITDFLPPTTQPNATPPQPHSDTTMSDSLSNAPLTIEPVEFADDGLRTHR